MLKFAVRYLVLTIAIALVGVALVIVGALVANGDPSKAAIAFIGVSILFLSPAISAGWYWFRRRRSQAHALFLQAEQNSILAKLADEERTKDFLRKRFLERERLIDAIDRHRLAISRNLHRAIKRNDYGAIVADNTGEVLYEFLSSINHDQSIIELSEAVELVLEQVEFRKVEDRAVGFDPTNIPFDGHSFENWVAEALVGFGWESEVTSASRDQGIDVIASKNGKKIGIQCKLYTAAVGNKAIQEAHAGKVYYGLDAAAVLTNANFTSSARDLAVVTGVKLFSHHDIPFLYEKTFG